MQEKQKRTTEYGTPLLQQIIGVVLSDRVRVWRSVSHMPRKGCIAPINNHSQDQFPEAVSTKHPLSDSMCPYSISSDSVAFLLFVSLKTISGQSTSMGNLKNKGLDTRRPIISIADMCCRRISHKNK